MQTLQSLKRGGRAMLASFAIAGLVTLGFANVDVSTAQPHRHVNQWHPFRDVGGHRHCRIRYGDTSVIRCAGGWETSS